eukprot:3173146-Alexandrium_andersonii.AAC.1
MPSCGEGCMARWHAGTAASFLGLGFWGKLSTSARAVPEAHALRPTQSSPGANAVPDGDNPRESAQTCDVPHEQARSAVQR